MVKLMEAEPESVYLMNDYSGGGLDLYQGEKILFMDEFRGQVRYSTLLNMLDGYRTQVHCRYNNVYALWTEVHITSVLPPEMVYNRMVTENKEVDTIQQLLRRLNEYCTDIPEQRRFPHPLCHVLRPDFLLMQAVRDGKGEDLFRCHARIQHFLHPFKVSPVSLVPICLLLA